MGSPHRIRIFATFLVLALTLSASGCRLNYLFHVAKGQMALLGGSVSIEEALETESFTPEQRKRLLLVAQIKAFGEKDLGLKKTSNYETVYPHKEQHRIYFVAASRKDRFKMKTWWFPIVGDLPYLGFFDLEEAQEEQKRLSNEDLDVYLGRAGAYSTLGWFQDPVTVNLIDGSVPLLANTLLHEMTHATLYVNGQGAFNEGLAVLVGTMGAFRFFEKTFGTNHPFTIEARDALMDERIFSRFLNRLMSEMADVYGLQVEDEEKMVLRKRVYGANLERFDLLKREFRTEQFVHFDGMPVNNAYLLTVALYHQHFGLFEAVLNKKGGAIKKMIQYLADISPKEKDLIKRLQAVTDPPDARGGGF